MPVKQNIKIAVDAIVFGYTEHTLYVLLVKQKYGELKNSWVLPGGFVKDKESLVDAVNRELKEETGIAVNYMEQLYTFGDNIERDPRGRVVSVAYFGLVNPAQLTLKADTDAADAQWFPVSKIPKVGFDHQAMITLAKNRLKSKLTYQPIGFDLLDHDFLFSDLENLYSTILEKEIDRRNFRKKLLSFDLLEETDLVSNSGSGRPARFFTFNKKKYNKLVKEGFYFEIKFA